MTGDLLLSACTVLFISTNLAAERKSFYHYKAIASPVRIASSQLSSPEKVTWVWSRCDSLLLYRPAVTPGAPFTASPSC
jgi:hypothetical protein